MVCLRGLCAAGRGSVAGCPAPFAAGDLRAPCPAPGAGQSTWPGPARPALCCAVAAVAPPRSAVAAALGKLCAVPFVRREPRRVRAALLPALSQRLAAG